MTTERPISLQRVMSQEEPTYANSSQNVLLSFLQPEVMKVAGTVKLMRVPTPPIGKHDDMRTISSPHLLLKDYRVDDYVNPL